MCADKHHNTYTLFIVYGNLFNQHNRIKSPFRQLFQLHAPRCQRTHPKRNQ